MQAVRFAAFDLRPDSRALLKDGEPVALGGRAFDLLLCLVSNRERVVPRTELMAAVWPGSVVVENNLNAQVAVLRRTLGAHAILNVARRGYRFVLEVVPAAGEPPVFASGRPSMAVLDFVNLSGDRAQDAIADGLAEDIVTALSGRRQFAVMAPHAHFVSRQRAADLRQVGQALGVGYVLEGSVRRDGQRLRVTAQLVETARGIHLWAGHVDGRLDDLFALQDEIAAQVAAAVEPAIREFELGRASRPSTRDE